MTGCVCPAAGYCERHKTEKNEHWHMLCQTREDYFAVWEAGRGPGQRRSPGKNKRAIKAKRDSESTEALHALWRELHSYSVTPWDADVALAWYKAWEKRIPSFGCSCKQHWAKIARKLPPDFSSAEAFSQWAIDAHNQVNKMLGKPIFVPPAVVC